MNSLHKDKTCASTTGLTLATTPLTKRVALLAAAVWLAAPLVGCGGGGGGGGDSTPAPVPAPAPPAPAPGPGGLGADYLVAGTSISETGGHSVLVADPDPARAAAVLSVPVQAAPPMLSTLAYTDEATPRTAIIRGSPMTFFVNGGQLWQIDLARSRTPVSVRISSLVDACRPQMAAPLDASGLDAWVLVSTAGPDGDCLTAQDNRQAFVRSGSPATEAATIVPDTTKVQPLYLSGTAGALWWMLALDTAGSASRLVAYGPTLNVVDVAGGSGVRTLNAQGHGSLAGEGTYVRADDELRLIDASATALSIGGAQFRFSGTSWVLVYERPAMYFTDANVVYRVEGAAPATQLARASAGSVSAILLAQSANKLVLMQEDINRRGEISAVDKRSGAVSQLLAQPGDGSNAVWSVRGETLYYFTGKPTVAGELRRVQLDGSDDALVVTNLLMVGRVTSRLWVKGETTEVGGTAAVLACQPLPGSADCRGSTLLQIDLATRAVTVLGSFDNSSAPRWLAQGGAAYEGVKGAVISVHSSTAASAGAFTRKDLYVFNPGEANSLKLVRPTTS